MLLNIEGAGNRCSALWDTVTDMMYIRCSMYTGNVYQSSISSGQLLCSASVILFLLHSTYFLIKINI